MPYGSSVPSGLIRSEHPGGPPYVPPPSSTPNPADSGSGGGGNASSATPNPPFAYSTLYGIPPPVIDLTGTGPCSWSQAGNNPQYNHTNAVVDPKFGTKPSPLQPNYPLVLLYRNCQTNQLYYFKTVDAALIGAGLVLAVFGAIAQEGVAAILGLLLIASGFLSMLFL